MNELRKAAEMALEALEIGYDSAQAEAHQFHAAMAGYKPQRHAAMDADVQKIAAAITALRQAIAEQPAQQEPVATVRTWHKNGDQHAELWNWDRGIESLPDGEHDLYTRPQAPATVPDRDRMGRLINRVCASCHALRLAGDMKRILELHEKRRQAQLGHKCGGGCAV